MSDHIVSFWTQFRRDKKSIFAYILHTKWPFLEINYLQLAKMNKVDSLHVPTMKFIR